MRRILAAFVGTLVGVQELFAQQEKVEVFPTVPYDQFIVYQNLILFWIGIIGLIVIIKMKLREIERIQKLGIDKEDENIPVLD